MNELEYYLAKKIDLYEKTLSTCRYRGFVSSKKMDKSILRHLVEIQNLLNIVSNKFIKGDDKILSLAWNRNARTKNDDNDDAHQSVLSDYKNNIRGGTSEDKSKNTTSSPLPLSTYFDKHISDILEDAKQIRIIECTPEEITEIAKQFIQDIKIKDKTDSIDKNKKTKIRQIMSKYDSRYAKITCKKCGIQLANLKGCSVHQIQTGHDNFIRAEESI